MCRHMYDALRRERNEGRPPQWLVTLREKQQGCRQRAQPPSPKHSARARPSAAAAAPPASSKHEVEKVSYDPAQGIAFRKLKGTKGLEPSTDIFAMPNARGHHFMQAKWADGYQAELTALTVSAWKGRREAAGKPMNKLKLYDEKFGDHGRVTLERKLLDNDNPGVVIKVNGSQKMQLSFKHVPQTDAEANAMAWAKAVVKGKIVDPGRELKEKKVKLEESFGVVLAKGGGGGAAKKRPAGGGGGGAAKRPAADDGGGDSALDEDEGGADDAGADDDDDRAYESLEDEAADEAAQEEGAEEEDAEIDEEVDYESDEAPAKKKPAAATAGVTNKQGKPAAAPRAEMKRPAANSTAAPVGKRPAAMETTDAESERSQLDGPPRTTVFSAWRNSFEAV